MRLLLALAIALFSLVGADSYAVRAGFPGRMGPPAIVSEAVVYAPESQAIFAAFTTPPTEARKVLINAAVTSLISSGVWSKLDSLQFYAAADAQAGRVDWRVPSRVAVEVNSPTFTPDRGYTGNGSSSYVDTNFNVSVGSNFVRDNNSAHLYVNGGDSAVSVVDMGNTTTSIGSRNAANNVAYRNSGIGTNNTVATVSSALGLTSSIRTGSANFSGYKDAVFIETMTRASVSLVSINIYVGAQNLVGVPSLFSTRRVAMVAFGGALTPQEMADFNAIVVTYLTAIGAN